MDNAVIYAPFHQFGIFSIFNEELLKSVQISTGLFDANHGGRVSSFMDVKTKTSLKDSIQKKIQIGVLSSKIFLHKKINSKSNYLLSLRGTYGNFFINYLSPNPASIYFYDGSIKFNYAPNNKTKWSIGSHFSTDRNSFEIEDKGTSISTDVRWINFTNIFNYQRILKKNKVLKINVSNSNFSLSNFNSQTSLYLYDDTSRTPTLLKNGLKMESEIIDLNNQIIIKGENWQIGNDATLHKINSSSFFTGDSLIDNLTKNNQLGFENSLFVQKEIEVSKWKLNGSLRINSFYNQFIMFDLAPRLYINHKINPANNLSLGIEKANQFLFNLASQGIGLPNNIWLSANKKIPFLKNWQYSLNHRFNKPLLSIFSSLYFKNESGTTSYLPGNTFSFNFNNRNSSNSNAAFEDRIMIGSSKNYGFETLIKFNILKIRNQLSYTLSKSVVLFSEANKGNWYPSLQDRPHKLNWSTYKKISKRWTFNSHWLFTSGKTATFINSSYVYSSGANDGSVFEYYGINNFRFPFYHRLDVNFTYLKVKQRNKLKWQIGIINLYNKRNINFYYTEKRQYKSISLAPILPTTSISWKW